MVGRGCSVVTSVGLRGVDGVLFVESDPVRNDGVDAHRARGVSLFRPGSSNVEPNNAPRASPRCEDRKSQQARAGVPLA